jgi:hypothetical protein
MSNNYPNFLIVGAAKSGTTTLHQLLKAHPEIYMPERKELNFWYTYGKKNWAILKRFPDLPQTPDEYLGYFQTDKKLKGEASPGYLAYFNETIGNLKKFHPFYSDVKIIIILREPTAKIWSHYKMVKRANMDPDGLTLAESIKRENDRINNDNYLLDVFPVFSTDYLKQVNAYLDNFTSVKVILFDDLQKSPQQVIDELTNFLEVSEYIPPQIEKKFNAAPKRTPRNAILEKLAKVGVTKLIPERIKKYRRYRYTKSEHMDKKIKNLLQKRFKKDLEDLQILINKDLSIWTNKYK